MPDHPPRAPSQLPTSDIDLSSIFGNGSAVQLKENDRLRFARQVLMSLLFLCAGIFTAYGLNPESRAMEQMFELVKNGALPLITLVISFYFLKSA